MSIAIGTYVGPYEITGWLGAGGMGEVYRARDPRLGRDVAIKLVLEAFAANATRLHRFEQEARAAGQLNHPGIVSVYDIGTYDGAPYVVSELLEGESLRNALQSHLPPRKAADYARQIADALAAAHDKGIVHRDLKPDNLFVSSAGRVKILDFGLAKLTQPSDDTAANGAAPADTEAGTVLGTAGYMSPEQVRGERADHRSDIFSLGAVVYEMLAGRPAFTRGSGAETMAAILKDDPSTPFSPTTTPALERVVLRCLEKNREARFQSARDLAFDLQGLSEAIPSATAVPGMPNRRGARRWGWALAGVLALGLALAMMRWAPWPPATPSSPPLRLSVELGAGLPLAPINVQFGDAVTISPDGSTIAFVARARAESLPQIYVRRLDRIDAVPLSGTDGALIPFFSPDGKSIGFFSRGELKKIAVTGGAAVTLAEAPDQRGASWGDDNIIVFSPDRRPGTRLMRVSADGGDAAPLTTTGEGEGLQLWPQFLPGSKAVLYTAANTQGFLADAHLVVQAWPDGTPKVVHRGGFHGRYLPSGHLVYIHDGTLFAAPFDLDRLEMTAPPVPALEGVRANSITGGAHFSISNGGLMAYLPGPSIGGGTVPHWMNRDGNMTPMKAAPANWFNVAFAPDGSRLAMEIRDTSVDIWVHELVRGTVARLTSDPAADSKPAWTPDGRRLTFASTRANPSTTNLFWQLADGSGAATRLTHSANAQQPGSWHPGGRLLVFEETHPKTSIDLMVLPLDGSEASGWKPGHPAVFLNDRGRQSDPAFSPDGRWLAYVSNESGRAEIYVRPFPGPGGKWQISTEGGTLPIWSRLRPELFYGMDGEIMVVPYVARGDVFQAGKPAKWSEGRYESRGPNRMFDLHPDGARVVLTPPSNAPGTPPPDRIVLIFNFFGELQRLAPIR